MHARRIWPVTIIRTRYGGVYERGEWAAFPLGTEAVPPAATGSDTECADFWAEFGDSVGVGATPDAALEDLEDKVRPAASKSLRGSARGGGGSVDELLEDRRREAELEAASNRPVPPAPGD